MNKAFTSIQFLKFKFISFSLKTKQSFLNTGYAYYQKFTQQC